MGTVTIEVTQEDIDNGVGGNCAYCPVARAAARAFPDKPMVRVGSNILWVFDTLDTRRPRMEYTLPVKASDFIARFDKHGPEAVAPFTFTIDTSEGVII